MSRKTQGNRPAAIHRIENIDWHFVLKPRNLGSGTQRSPMKFGCNKFVFHPFLSEEKQQTRIVFT